MHYSGAVYRPPSEARSLIVQCTLGCSHNKCAFCTMYKDKKFSINPIEQVLADLAESRAYAGYIEKIFLADGDALILPMDYLLTVLDYIRDNFPKYVVSLDEFDMSRNGIKHRNIRDFLLAEEWN